MKLLPCPRHAFAAHEDLAPHEVSAPHKIPALHEVSVPPRIAGPGEQPWGPAGLYRNESGMVTVEAAYSLVALIAVLVLCLGGIQAGLVQIRITDAAHAIARQEARGSMESHVPLPSGASVEVQHRAGVVEVTIAAPVRLLPLTLRAHSSCPEEPVLAGRAHDAAGQGRSGG